MQDFLRMMQKVTLGKEEAKNEPVYHTQPMVKTGGDSARGLRGARPCTPGAPTSRFLSPLPGTEDMTTSRAAACPAPPRRARGPPPHFYPRERPSAQREARGTDLVPEGRGRAPRWQKDDSPPCCSELLAGDSPACAWPLFSRAGSAVQPTDAPANRRSS